MENRPTSDPALPKKVQCRSLCVTPNGSSLNLRQLETTPRGYLHRCNDSQLVDWSLLKGYAFPPFSLIAPVLKKVSQDKADLVLVATVGQAQPWWPALLNLIIKNPVMIPNSLLRNPASPLRIHPMYPRLHLAVFQLSGDSTKQKGFSGNITRILESATRASAHKTYQSAFGLWHSWCANQQVNSILATLSDVILFLTDRFNNGAAYRSVNV